VSPILEIYAESFISRAGVDDAFGGEVVLVRRQDSGKQFASGAVKRTLQNIADIAPNFPTSIKKSSTRTTGVSLCREPAKSTSEVGNGTHSQCSGPSNMLVEAKSFG
jgi:hypothetical protein